MTQQVIRDTDTVMTWRQFQETTKVHDEVEECHGRTQILYGIYSEVHHRLFDLTRENDLPKSAIQSRVAELVPQLHFVVSDIVRSVNVMAKELAPHLTEDEDQAATPEQPPETPAAAGSLHETLKSQLREVFLGWKAFNAAGEDDDTPIGAPLCQRANDAEKKIRDLDSNATEVLIAKLIVSMDGEARNKAVSGALAAEVALAGLRSFGLEEFYDECYPHSRKAEAAS
jgi:hypothetical protein